MSDSDGTDDEKVTEEDVIIQTPNGERYPASVIDLSGRPIEDE